jgi:predicted metal-dependent peptidase
MPVPRVAVAVDTSGSMGQRELTDALREAKGILTAVGANVEFLACDAEVHAARPVRTWRDCIPLLKGGGGTDFTPVFRELERRPHRPEVLVFITDGCGPAPESPPGWCKTIWLTVGPYQRKPAEWGEHIEMHHEQQEA